MYCKNCGKEVVADAKFCSYCGVSVAREPEEEVVFNPPFESDPEFVWNLHEFPEPKATDEVDFSWDRKNLHRETGSVEIEIPGEPELPKAPEFLEAPEALDVPDVQKQTEAEEGLEFVPPPMPQDALEIAQLIPEQETKIDKFYTFNKKNEEFQKLLDREYEKIRSGETDFDEELNMQAMESLADSTEEPEQEEAPQPESAESKSAEEEIIFDNDTLAKRFDTKELHRDLIESALEKAGTPGMAFTQSLPTAPEVEKPENPHPVLRDKPPVEIRDEYKSGFIPKFIEEFAANTQELRLESAQDVRPQIRKEVTEGVAEPEIPEPPLTEPELLEEIKPEFEIELVSEPETELPEMDEAKQAAFKALEELWDGPEKPREPEKPEKDPPAPSSEESEQTQKSGMLGKVVLTIVILLLLMETGILAIRYLMPGSEASAFVNEKLGFAVRWLEEIAAPKEDQQTVPDDGDADKQQEQEEPEQAEEPEKPVPEEPGLVESQLSYNNNIEKVEANDALAYDAAKDYGVTDINRSAPLTGEQLNDSKAVVAALIAFDSQWIDFVNEGDKAILSLTKPGGTAEKNILNFKKPAGLTKTFKLLQIGEIRQGKDGFYVWAHEALQNKTGEKTEDKSYDYVYHLQQSGDKMLIVGYYQF